MQARIEGGEVLTIEQRIATEKLSKQLEIDQTILEEKAYLQAQHSQEQAELLKKKQEDEIHRKIQEKKDRQEAKRQVMVILSLSLSFGSNFDFEWLLFYTGCVLFHVEWCIRQQL